MRRWCRLAISKILNMKDCGGHFHGKHLKRALDYVMNPDKTQDGGLVGTINCQVDTAFESDERNQAVILERLISVRGGIISYFPLRKMKLNPDYGIEITEICGGAVKKSYEAVFVVHDSHSPCSFPYRVLY